jgi:hypothetical protein
MFFSTYDIFLFKEHTTQRNHIPYAYSDQAEFYYAHNESKQNLVMHKLRGGANHPEMK